MTKPFHTKTLSDISFGVQSSTSLGAVLHERQQKNLAELRSIAVPSRKTENWKYSAKHLKLSETYSQPAPTSESNKTTDELASNYELDSINIVIHQNGQIDIDSASKIDSALSIKRFSELNEHEAQAVLNIEDAHHTDLIFAKLNGALYQDGLYICVQKNSQVNKPIRVIFESAKSGACFPRVLVKLETGACATLIEELAVSQDMTSDVADTLMSSVCDIELSANARMKYLRMNPPNVTAKHIGLTHVQLNKDAHFTSHCLGLGSPLARHDLHVKMLEPGAECDLSGVCVTKGTQHFDNHTCIEHIAPHCTSSENYRCIADDTSHIVFNGRIHIHRDAQKTLGEMSNKNLILSSGAEIDSKPELEIYADDVKCAHGTTIGQLDETELYYLQTRGVSESQARQMLTLGFVLEVVRSAPVEAIAELWEATLSNLLSYQSA